MDTDLPEREAEPGRADGRRTRKRRMLVALCCLVAFAAIAAPAVRLADRLASRKPARRQPPHAGVNFCEPDYDLDVMRDSEYLGLDRQIHYSEGGVTVVMDERNRDRYGDAPALLYEMLRCIVEGDSEAYNALFSDAYYDSFEPKDGFTMQEVYDIRLSKEGEEEVRAPGGGTYARYLFEVSYRIRRNNGTFRTDIGHDESRVQLFILSDRTGRVLVDDVRS